MRWILGLFAFLALLGPARAEEDVDLDSLEVEPDVPEEKLRQTLLVVPFVGETAASAGAGSLLESYLRDRLSARSRFTALGLEEAPPIEDVGAALYYEGCPKGDELGCAFVLGEKADVDRVVTGRVTLRESGNYRVVVIILNIRRAEEEFRYALDLVPGEEGVFARSVELSLDKLQRTEVLAPRESAREVARRKREAMAEAASQEERDLVARMGLGATAEELREADERLAVRPERRVEMADLDEYEGVEGGATPWGDLGITKSQYLSYKNSGLDFDAWRVRWAGHRLMLLGTFGLGFGAGATSLEYFGGYMLSPDLQEVVADYAWQVVGSGSAPMVTFGGGFGILRNLDVEANAFWMQGRATVQLMSGSTIADGQGGFTADPTNRPAGDAIPSRVNLWGGEVMARFYILPLPIVRPTVGAGVAWVTYPSLYNDPTVDDAVEDPEPAIKGRFPTFEQLTDAGPQVELGVMFDVHKNFGIFARLPIWIPVNAARSQRTDDAIPSLLTGASEPTAASPVLMRLAIGVQGRLFGLPVQPKRAWDATYVEE
jgi:hypothetical protein